MATIKERREALNQLNIWKENPDGYAVFYTIRELEIECEQTLGHVNMNTITRDDNSHYYICDECGKQVELGYY